MGVQAKELPEGSQLVRSTSLYTLTIFVLPSYHM